METKRAPLLSRFRITSLVIVGLAVVVAVMALQMKLGTPDQPGPGMWPLIIAVFIGACALLLLFTEHDGADYEPLTKRSWIVILGFALMAGYVLAFTYVGFTAASLLFSFIWLRFFAKERWLVVWLGTIGFTAAFVIVFAVLLKVPVPHDYLLSLITTGRLS